MNRVRNAAHLLAAVSNTFPSGTPLHRLRPTAARGRPWALPLLFRPPFRFHFRSRATALLTPSRSLPRFATKCRNACADLTKTPSFPPLSVGHPERSECASAHMQECVWRARFWAAFSSAPPRFNTTRASSTRPPQKVLLARASCLGCALVRDSSFKAAYASSPRRAARRPRILIRPVSARRSEQPERARVRPPLD